jgi:UDP-glucuronate decarboxylase
LTGSRSRIVHKPLPVDDPPRRRPDISLAREMLSWAPRVDLETGLRKTIAYFEEVLRAGDDPLAVASTLARQEVLSQPQVQMQ